MLADAPGETRPSVIIEVVDTGVGMDEETKRRCLEPFFTTKGERGTGLGLAMVFGMIRRHGGDISVETSEGYGTTFRLEFPVLSETNLTDPEPPMALVPEPLRLLIADDDPVLLKSLRDALEADGHTIVTADGGQFAINAFLQAKAQRQPFDVVISDLGMPRVDGYKVAGAIKAVSPGTPVLLLTGWGQRLAIETGQSVVDRILSKPPKLRELRQALAELARPAQA